jgi:pyruvate dehydrogenase E2 component (dihydrolipoamide acetyltransferase)
MAIPITIPRLGWSMEEGVFAGWLKRDGEPVRAGEALFTLEGDKAAQEIEAIDNGILKVPHDAPAAGATVTVGAVIGFLLEPGEVEPAVSRPSAPIAAALDAGENAQAQRRNVAADCGAGVPPAASESAGETPAPQVSQREWGFRAGPEIHPESRAVRSDRPRSSPLARRLAREHGVDWTKLKGSGSSGRIRRVDVMAAVEAKADERSNHDSPGQHAVAAATNSGRSLPASRTRRAIAARMMESRRTTAPVTLTTTANAANLVALRRQFQSAETATADAPGFTDFLVKLTAIVLRDHPLLNARWTDGEDQIILHEIANIGIAVDTESGLVVPVIRSAASLGIRQIAALSRELIAKAQERRLRSEEIAGATFTITNLGHLGVETFTPIINPPECAILGVGKIERRPVMDGDNVVGREQMSLGLTFDHRIVDGAPAARFLNQLVRAIENPAPWLMP